MGEHSPARVLAPAALAAFALVFVIVVALSMARTGVPIERLQELHPSLDPQMLRPGQRLKLRR